MFKCGSEVMNDMLFKANLSGLAEVFADSGTLTRLIQGHSSRATPERIQKTYHSLIKVLDQMLLDSSKIDYFSLDESTRRNIDCFSSVDYKSRISEGILKSVRDHAQSLVDGDSLDNTSLDLLASKCYELSTLSLDAYDGTLFT